MSASQTAQLLDAAAAVAPLLLDAGQGYESVAADSLAVEVVWYRETETTWTVSLAVESPARRVQTPPGTVVELSSELAREVAHEQLARELAGVLVEMAAEAGAQR